MPDCAAKLCKIVHAIKAESQNSEEKNLRISVSILGSKSIDSVHCVLLEVVSYPNAVELTLKFVTNVPPHYYRPSLARGPGKPK